MDITWLGHSCFRLRSDQVTLMTDPFPDSIGLTMGSATAQVVTISHDHPHHNHLDGVTGEYRVFDGPGEYEYRGLLMRGVMTPPGANDPPEKRNTAYHIEMDGVRICHLGDIASTLLVRHIDDLSPVDVLLVPVGQGCTVSPAQTQELIRALSPKIVVPMHYRLPGLAVELADVEPFLREQGARELTPQPRLNVTTTNLPAEMRVSLLTAQGLRQ